MGLNLEQIKNELKENRNGRVLSQARAHQERIKLHTDATMSVRYTQPLSDFLSFVEALLPKDKFKMFKTLMRYPLPTNEVTSTIFDKLSKVFEGQNPSSSYSFLSPDDKDDWEDYRTRVLKEPEIWKTVGWEFLKSEINSVLVIDLPQDQVSERPEPYFYWLRIKNVIAYSADPVTGIMDWIIFHSNDGDNAVIVLDDTSYRKFSYTNNMIGDTPMVEHTHDLGYCPARFFCNVPLNIDCPDVKKSPVSDVLEKLDWYLFYYTSKKHLDLYGSYPIYSGYAQECDYEDEVTGHHCDGGFLKDKHDKPLYDSAGLPLQCPKCGQKKISGPGSFVEVPVPSEGQPDLRNPVSITSVDRQSLDYNVNEVERLKNDIIDSSVGVDASVITTQAINEKQVTATYESKTTILGRIKNVFEEARKFVDETICRLRYGNSFIDASISMGTSFFILSPMDMRNNYTAAKNSGASESELDAMRIRIIQAEYKNDPVQLQKMLTLNYVEPLRHMTRSEAIDAFDKGLVSREKLVTKINFPEFISRFENENGSIVEFGSLIPFEQKIRKISEVLSGYASEEISKTQINNQLNQ